jgi:hypothetical protein
MSIKGSLTLYGFESTAGERSRNCKVTDDQVRAIYREIGKPEEIALKYGLTANYVHAIKRKSVRKDALKNV